MEVLDSPLPSQPVSGDPGRMVREAFVTLGYWSLFWVISFSSCDPGNVSAFKNPEVLPRSQVTDLCNCPFLSLSCRLLGTARQFTMRPLGTAELAVVDSLVRALGMAFLVWRKPSLPTAIHQPLNGS